MRLLEVVRGAKTSREVVATSMKLAKQIGKVPVLSGVCYGFIANRIMSNRSKQAEAVILEGPTPAEVDKALYDYGFAIGPFQMIDLVGLDVLTRGLTERTIRGDFVAAGRFGQKNGAGFYDYDENRKATPSPVAAEVIATFAAFKGVEKGGPQSQEEILGRLLYPVVNEGAKVLEEGIALRASDIDMACILGYNWPIYTGGPMFWADTVGLPKIVAALKALQAKHGDIFKPAALLEKLAAEGGSFTTR
jgi:3-hydroxyacyl-CoA dehydrogenase